MNIQIKVNSFSDAYYKVICNILNNPDFISSPRGYKIKECINMLIEIYNPRLNLFNNEYRGIPLSYLKKELQLYLSARNDADGFINASKFWKNIKNDDNTINSAYGHLIFNKFDKSKQSQFDWAYDSLMKDSDSRQAIMHYNRPIHQYENVKDFPCTLNNVFIIRDNKLYMTTMMRSNDVRKGLQFDIPFFTLVQWLMLLRLKEQEKYQNLELGSYVHISNSMHAYEEDFELLENMKRSMTTSSFMPLPDTWDIIKSKHIKDISNGKKIKIYEDEPNYKFLKWIMDV